jgi:hypothetical protein
MARGFRRGRTVLAIGPSIGGFRVIVHVELPEPQEFPMEQRCHSHEQ